MRRRMLIWTMLAVTVLLGCTGHARAQEGRPTIEEIIAKWEERQNKVLSARFRWDEEETQTKGMVSRMAPPVPWAPKDQGPIPPQDFTYTGARMLFFDHNKLFCEAARRLWLKGWLDFTEQFTFNGAIGKNWLSDNGQGHPAGQIRSEDFHTEVSNFHYRPILMAFRATYPKMAPYRASTFKLTGKRALIDGKSCLEIIALPQFDTEQTLWVDATSDYSVIRFVDKQHNVDCWKVDVKYKPDSKVGWVPTSWSLVQRHPRDGSLLMSTRATVNGFEINPKLRDSEFDIVFPPGTYVRDEKANSAFIQKDDGQVRPIERSEVGRPYEELLATPPRAHSSKMGWWFVVIGAVVLIAAAIAIVGFWNKRHFSRGGA